MNFKVLVSLCCALANANLLPFEQGQIPLKVIEDGSRDVTVDASASGNYWLGQISHDGSKSIYHSSYKVYRNVLDFGAKGDGLHDDTEAIQDAISSTSTRMLFVGHTDLATLHSR